MNTMRQRIESMNYPFLRAAAAAFAVLAAILPSGAQTSAAAPLTLAQVAARALENDPAVAASRAAAETARVQYELKLDEARPRFILGLTPFSLDQRRLFSADGDTFSGSPPYDLFADIRTLSAGGGLTLNQALPTAGSLSAGAKTSFKAIDTDGDLEYELTPSLSANLRQPLGAGGQFLPTNAAEGAKRSASLAADQAALDDRSRRNQAVRNAVDLAGRVLVLRAVLDAQSAGLESARRRAESALLRRRGGTATEDTALELELAAETLRASRDETRLSLRDAERRLAGLLGLAEAPSLSSRLPLLSTAPAPEPSASPEALRAALALDKAAADAAARAVADSAALGVNVSVEPRYPDSRPNPSDPGTILSDYFGGGTGAGVNLNLTLTLDVPLSVREARTLRSRADAAAAQTASANLRAAERSVLERATALEERRVFLADRIEIQKRIADLSRRKWERLRDLAAAGTVPADDADAAKTDWDRSVTDVLRTELDLILAELDMRILRGEDLAVVLAGAK